MRHLSLTELSFLLEICNSLRGQILHLGVVAQFLVAQDESLAFGRVAKFALHAFFQFLHRSGKLLAKLMTTAV